MTDERPPSLLEVERSRQGLLDEAAAARVRRQLEAGDPTAGLPDDDTVFREDPPERFVRNVHAALAEQQAPRRRLRRFAPILAMATVLLVAAPVIGDLLPSDGPGDIVTKGVVLSIYRNTSDGPELLADGTLVSQGDVLQTRFSASGLDHGVVYSVDGRGQLTIHQRFDTPQKGTVTVPKAYQLDDAPDYEVFHLVAAKEAFDVRALLAEAADEAHRVDGPPLPRGARHRSVLLRKAGGR
jgi:hypothetical protein